MNDERQENARTSAADRWYVLATGGLMIVIIVTLAILLYRERASHRETLKKLRGYQTLQQLQMLPPPELNLGGADDGATEPIRREDVPSVPITLNGHDRRALLISPQAGQRLGFAPGDVVLVGEDRESTTAPAGDGPAQP